MITLPLEEMAYLSTLYAQSHRHYHNIDHINFCLGELEKCDGVSHETRRIVTYAIWYHDAVYNPYSAENEYQSEEMFYRQHQSPSILTFEEFDAIGTAIRATAYHTKHQPNLEFSSHLMLDIDLAGLGQDWRVFQKNGEQIRKEYAHIEDGVFNRARVEFFEALQKRPTIYYTDFFKARYEASARENVDIEIKRLYSL